MGSTVMIAKALCWFVVLQLSSTCLVFRPLASSPSPSPSPAPSPSPTPAGSCRCGRANTRTKIVGGATTEENEYPWQVGLLSSRFSSKPFCGGTLVSSREVLTAAHCTRGSTAAYVLLGEHDLTKSDGEKKVRVCGTKNNPNYNSGTVDYDFSILELCEDVSFTTDISPACLPTSSSTNYDNRRAVVSGWGTLSTGGTTPSVLIEATINTMSNAQCTRSPYIYTGNVITDRMLCATASGKDACHGDSGGPLVTKESGGYYTVIGVVSWGYGCAEARAPGVYARVTSQLSWINGNLRGTTCPSS